MPAPSFLANFTFVASATSRWSKLPRRIGYSESGEAHEKLILEAP